MHFSPFWLSLSQLLLSHMRKMLLAAKPLLLQPLLLTPAKTQKQPSTLQNTTKKQQRSTTKKPTKKQLTLLQLHLPLTATSNRFT
jgi:hypothetical protein